MEKLTVQNAIGRLEKIVEELGEGTTIEEGLKKFREGVALVKMCKEELKQAENEFIKLKEELTHE